jgi:6-phosphogluconolactonase
MMRLLVAADPAGAARLAAEVAARTIRGAVAVRGRAMVALAGGSTPRRLHGLLADPAGPCCGAVDWARVHLLLGDERCVPPDHPDSNFRMVQETLLRRLPIPSRQVHRWLAEDPDPGREARRHEGVMRALFPAGTPRLDLVLLGMGADGHVASLFPGSAALAERRAWTAAPFVERLGAYRLTVTLPVIEAAGTVLLLATGKDKAACAALAWGGPGLLPAQRLRSASGELVLVLDAASARDLRTAPFGETGPGSRNVV